MTYAPITFQDDGNRTYQIPFPYLAADHVRVSVNGMAATADQFTIDGNTLDWTGGGFESLTLSRRTPSAELYVMFSDGRPTTAEEKNRQSTWLLYICQELIYHLMALVNSPEHRNEQADWGETDPESHSFIRGKEIVEGIFTQLRQEIAGADAKATATTSLLVQARTLAGIQGALSANAQGTGNTVAHELIRWLRTNYDLALPLPPRGTMVKHVWAGQGEDTFWEQAQFVPTPAESGLVLTSTGTGNTDYRWQGCLLYTSPSPRDS